MFSPDRRPNVTGDQGSSDWMGGGTTTEDTALPGEEEEGSAVIRGLIILINRNKFQKSSYSEGFCCDQA